MRVRLLERWATADFNHGPGHVVDVVPADARLMVAARHAEALDPFPVEPPAELESEPDLDPIPKSEPEVWVEPPADVVKPRGRRAAKANAESPVDPVVSEPVVATEGE